MVRLTFFGRLTDLAGSEPREVALPADVADVAALRSWLADCEPHLSSALVDSGVRVIVDESIVGNSHPVAGARDIGFIPPVSGG